MSRSRSHKAADGLEVNSVEFAERITARMREGYSVRFAYGGKIRQGVVETPPVDREGWVRVKITCDPAYPENIGTFRTFRVRHIEEGSFTYSP